MHRLPREILRSDPKTGCCRHDLGSGSFEEYARPFLGSHEHRDENKRDVVSASTNIECEDGIISLAANVAETT